MRHTRWGQSSQPNVADPTPIYPYPNAYDLQLLVDRVGMYLYIGPSRKLKDPNGKFDRANLIFLPGGFVPSLFNGWSGASRLKIKIQSKGAKSIQIDYLDVGGNNLGSMTYPFTV